MVSSDVTSPVRGESCWLGPQTWGKAALSMALLGFERVIVFDQPGTTRDVVTAETSLFGLPIELSDTAGIRSTRNDLEGLGVAKAQEQIERADLVILVEDIFGGSVGTPSCRPEKRFIRVRNKCDLARQQQIATTESCILTSATQRIGIDGLIHAVADIWFRRDLMIVIQSPFTARQCVAIEKAVDAINQGFDA